ncbi:hypothetical protein SVIO_059670 [Streptomyces violaceusniger]|uniref:Uncharacterized protein n=1 Tax=Streptomyces violaceusniger TaxID=68280 RepID=A0A4D4L4L8_STRVO|nr:hypothetical protein SVIO_059670 [Streptomyces violaceusniger]
MADELAQRPDPEPERRSPRWGWRAFKRSPFFPATVIVLIISAAAGLFAGSYTYAFANPTPGTSPPPSWSPLTAPSR